MSDVDALELAKSRVTRMDDRELAGEYAAHTLVSAYGLRLPEADQVIANERLDRARRAQS